MSATEKPMPRQKGDDGAASAPRLDGLGASAGSPFVRGVKVPPALAAYIQANDRPLYEAELLRFRGCGKVLLQKLIVAGLRVHERGKREKHIHPWQKTRIQETLESLRAKESRLIAKLEAVKQWLANCRQEIASAESDLKEANTTLTRSMGADDVDHG